MNIFQKYLAEEFAEDYQEGRLTRREALKLIMSVTGSAIFANTLLAACTPMVEKTTEGAPVPVATTGNRPLEENATTTQLPTEITASQTPAGLVPTAASPGEYGTVEPGDPAIAAGPVAFPGDDGRTLSGYQAYPKRDGPYAVVLVCHENRGLTEHIQDVTRRLAKAGYAALAVDLLSREGGTAKNDSSEVPGILGNIAPDQFVKDFLSGWNYLKTQSFAQPERVGMVGFCFGGGVTWRLATKMPELRAAIPFYGPHPPVEDVPGIQAAVMAVYGGKDTRINQGIPAIEEAMRVNKKIYEKVIYPNADHAFHNDTGTRYDPAAARDAWNRTLAWFRKYLG